MVKPNSSVLKDGVPSFPVGSMGLVYSPTIFMVFMKVNIPYMDPMGLVDVMWGSDYLNPPKKQSRGSK